MGKAFFAGGFVVLLMASSAYAQDKAKLTGLMNASQICNPINVKIKDLADFLGRSLPALLPDGNIGVDRGNHEVNTFNLDAASARVEGKIGCQPSDQGVPFKAPFNLDPKNYRVTDSFDCRAVIANRQVTSMTCSISGEIGKLLGKQFDINDQMKQIVQAAIQ